MYINSKILPIGNQPLPEQQFCLHLNVSECATTESSTRFVATAYNPRSQEVTTYVRLPVRSGVYVVLDPDGKHTIIKCLACSPPNVTHHHQTILFITATMRFLINAGR